MGTHWQILLRANRNPASRIFPAFFKFAEIHVFKIPHFTDQRQAAGGGGDHEGTKFARQKYVKGILRYESVLETFLLCHFAPTELQLYRYTKIWFFF